MDLTVDILLWLFSMAMLAGFVDAMAGGGGLITIPALLTAGIPPTMALGSNKLQACAGSFSASWYFVRSGMVNLRQMLWPIICVFCGAITGAFIVQQLDVSSLKALLPILIFAVGMYFLLFPSAYQKNRDARVSYFIFALTAGLGIGFYDGFFGPGTGSFFCLAYVVLMGLNLSQATAHAKVLNFTSNFAALLLFLYSGQIIWQAGLVMMVGQFFGARLGAKVVLKHGSKWIRPAIITVSMVMSIKLGFDYGWLSYE